MTDKFGYGEIGLDINPRHPCEGCRDYEAPDGCKSNGGCGKPMTNGDKIRSMTDEELAEWLFHAWHKSWYTLQEWSDWLKATAEEGER